MFDSEAMQHALVMAMHARDQGEVPVGAVVVHDNQIIGEGWNQPISTSDPTAHAEINAIRAAADNIGNYRLVNCDLYVTLEPCLMCVGAIVHARIKRLVFGAFDPKSGAVCSVHSVDDASFLNHAFAYKGGIMADKCGDLLRQFFQSRR